MRFQASKAFAAIAVFANVAVAQDNSTTTPVPADDAANNSNGTLSLSSTVLIIGRDENDTKIASPGLDGYGIPWQKALIPKNGGPLPQFNSSSTEGLYGSIILIGSLSYNYGGSFRSALTNDQWQQIFDYQSRFNVRMVRIDEYPGPLFGATPYNPDSPGCCDDSVDQTISFTDMSLFPGANLRADAHVSMKGLYHVPAKITDPNTTTAFAAFDPAGSFKEKTVAGVINKFAGGREQMVWFTSLAPEWSLTSTYLQHSYIHWMTRSLFTGKRKLHLTPQIDDMQISTSLYYPADVEFQITTGDLDAHIPWQKSLNSRLPAGSNVILEMGHNGNGNLIEAGAVNANDSLGACRPEEPVAYDMPTGTSLEYKKTPLGSGVDVWPPAYEKYDWSEDCSKLGKFASWFRDPKNLNAYGHVSHTFTHEELNNATYHDAAREIQFNQAWMKQLGIDRAERFSPNGLIPPAITGVKNGDAIRAWTDNGIKYVVGDNTRPTLRNLNNKFWPLASTVETNGATGIWIVPRYSTTIYFNCDKPECILREWKAISNRTGTFDDLLNDARLVNTHYLLALQADPYMFHQANMRQTDMPVSTVGTETGKMSLVMSWVETIAQELTRLTNWPIISLRHDDVGRYFVDRLTLDGCQPKSKYIFSADRKSIVAVEVTTANGSNSCDVPVAVTIPDGNTSGGQTKLDKVGSEPPIVWVTMTGSPVTLRLSQPVKI